MRITAIAQAMSCEIHSSVLLWKNMDRLLRENLVLSQGTIFTGILQSSSIVALIVSPLFIWPQLIKHRCFSILPLRAISFPTSGHTGLVKMSLPKWALTVLPLPPVDRDPMFTSLLDNFYTFAAFSSPSVCAPRSIPNRKWEISILWRSQVNLQLHQVPAPAFR